MGSGWDECLVIYGCESDIVIEFEGDSVVRCESNGMVELDRIDVLVFESDVQIMLDIQLMEEIKLRIDVGDCGR